MTDEEQQQEQELRILGVRMMSRTGTLRHMCIHNTHPVFYINWDDGGDVGDDDDEDDADDGDDDEDEDDADGKNRLWHMCIHV